MMGEKEKYATSEEATNTDEKIVEEVEVDAEDVEIIDKAEAEDDARSEAETEIMTEENFARLQAEHKALTEEIETVKERMLRVQAEYDNYRKRTEKERIASRKYEAESLATELLQVIDNFERALQTEVDESAQGFYDGVKMVYGQFIEALKTQGVEVMEVENEPFDPNLHHAVMQEEDDSKESNIVTEELQKGYLLKDKVIRPAMVKVNK